MKLAKASSAQLLSVQSFARKTRAKSASAFVAEPQGQARRSFRHIARLILIVDLSATVTELKGSIKRGLSVMDMLPAPTLKMGSELSKHS